MSSTPVLDRAALADAGFARQGGAISPPTLERLRALAPEAGAGVRLSSTSPLAAAAMPALASVVSAWNPAARAVRWVLFDKSTDVNWAVPWHQDRTIALAGRRTVPGYGPWSIKHGVVHVEPPFAVLAAMLTLRLHLDDCPAENAPLLIVPGSHRQRHPVGDVAAIGAAGPVVACTAAAGDVWAYATPIVHASQRATRPSRRRVLQVDFCAADLPAGLAWAA